jgi:hypothetical protein
VKAEEVAAALEVSTNQAEAEEVFVDLPVALDIHQRKLEPRARLWANRLAAAISTAMAVATLAISPIKISRNAFGALKRRPRRS